MQKLKLTAVALMLLPLLSGAAVAAKSEAQLNIEQDPQSLTGPLELPPAETNPPM